MKLKTKHIYKSHDCSNFHPGYILQLGRAGYNYCRVVYQESGNSYIFTNRPISTRQAQFRALKKRDITF